MAMFTLKAQADGNWTVTARGQSNGATWFADHIADVAPQDVRAAVGSLAHELREVRTARSGMRRTAGKRRGGRA